MEDVRKAQRLAGSLNWLATRTRPDISFIVSQLASAATKAPLRAIALGKRTLRYLAGARGHGILMCGPKVRRNAFEEPGVGPYSLESGGTPTLGCFGGASHEEGYAQTRVVIKLPGMPQMLDEH